MVVQTACSHRVPVLYQNQLDVGRDDIPRAAAESHTMGSAIGPYVAQRVPGRFLDEVLRAGLTVEVHGIYPHHVRHVFPGARLVHPGRVFQRKTFNILRPRFFTYRDGGIVIAAVPPGHDYVLHNASLIRHYLGVAGHRDDALSRVVRYPRAEETIARWTGLAGFVRPGDRLLIGYVNEVGSWLLHHGGEVVERRESRFYGITRVRLPGGHTVVLLGVRYSFWGCISGRLARECQRLGAAEIIYVGKLGTLTSPEDIYRGLFVPSAYVNYDDPSRSVVTATAAPPNWVLRRFPDLDSGAHLSIGTVLGEDFALRSFAEEHRVRSVDNEIAKIVYALSAVTDGHRTAFSAVHFATDYLRRAGEDEPPRVYNLTNHRVDGALDGKRRKIAEIARLLLDHYGATGGGRAGAARPRTALSATTTATGE
jgi:hypothetical protein